MGYCTNRSTKQGVTALHSNGKMFITEQERRDALEFWNVHTGKVYNLTILFGSELSLWLLETLDETRIKGCHRFIPCYRQVSLQSSLQKKKEHLLDYDTFWRWGIPTKTFIASSFCITVAWIALRTRNGCQLSLQKGVNSPWTTWNDLSCLLNSQTVTGFRFPWSGHQKPRLTRLPNWDAPKTGRMMCQRGGHPCSAVLLNKGKAGLERSTRTITATTTTANAARGPKISWLTWIHINVVQANHARSFFSKTITPACW